MYPDRDTLEQLYPARDTLQHARSKNGGKWRDRRREKHCQFSLSSPGALSIQLTSPEISVGSSNGPDHFGLVRAEYLGPALKVVHCERSGHFGRLDRTVPFHLPKLLSPVPLFSILLTRPSSFQWKVTCCE